MNIISILMADSYKMSHPRMLPENVTKVYGNCTPRSGKHAPKGITKVVSFGQQLLVRWLKEEFDNNFFSNPDAVAEIKKELELHYGTSYDASHLEGLHELGYLPLEFKSLPEGVEVPFGVPLLTWHNTHPDFAWLPLNLETPLSTMYWKMPTSATIALQYKRLLTKWCLETDKDNIAFVDYQGHDFSARGLAGIDATWLSGLGHLTSFMGSDTLAVIPAARKFYDAEGLVSVSVPATEHSIMSAGGAEEGNEIATFRYLMKQFPAGILSIVSDTWDLWKVLTEYLPELKEEILARDGKIVIRPDSGDPVDIICGNSGGYSTFTESELRHPNYKGVVELLWDIFGGTINEQGFKVLDPHIGAIYGDSITLERADEICKRLAAKGFASTNIVLGIGSFTYQFNTRDTFGFAMKATYVELEIDVPGNYVVAGSEFKTIGREIFKDPITDDGIKKSAKGLLMVQKNDFNGDYELVDQVSWKEEHQGELKTIYVDGVVGNKTTLSEVRARLKSQ